MSLELGYKLKLLRKNAHLTQKQVADALNINRTTYTYYELGKTEPNIDMLCALAKVLNVSYAQMLPETGVTRVSRRNLTDRRTMKEKIYELSKDEQNIVLAFRNMSDEERNEFLEKLGKDGSEESPEGSSENL